MATATAKVPREVLYDRYQGLQLDDTDGGEWTPLQQELSSALCGFVAGTARCHRDDAANSGVLDELYEIIREHVVKRVDELGLANESAGLGGPIEPDRATDGSIVREGVSGWNR